MNFPDTLVWFREPGFAVFFFASCVVAYHVSVRANLFVQLALCVFCGSFISSHWAKDQYHSMALYWMYAGWAGFLFHKLGGIVLLRGIGRVIRHRFESMGQGGPVRAQDGRQERPQAQTYSSQSDRRESYSQQNEAFRERERRRQQEQASAQRETEQNHQRQSRSEPPPQSDPDPEPKPKQEEKKTPPPTERERKQFWWEVLDIPESSDLPTIKKAYRAMIQKYHPDRVSHLGEEFQVIAEDKTKRINGAFDEAKKRRS